jgi:hypothetical protein
MVLKIFGRKQTVRVCAFSKVSGLFQQMLPQFRKQMALSRHRTHFVEKVTKIAPNKKIYGFQNSIYISHFFCRFPPEEWDSISDEAKDLITHLLVSVIEIGSGF